jgi:hypothetical protein
MLTTQFGGELSVNRAEPDTIVEAKIPLFAANLGGLI